MGSVSSAIANAARESGAHIVTSAEVSLVQLLFIFLKAPATSENKQYTS